MSENKQKEAANAASTSKTPSKGAKHVCGKLTSIWKLVSEVKDDPASFLEHETIVADRDALKKQLAEKDESSKKQLEERDQLIAKLKKEVERLNSYNKGLWDQFREKYTEFVNEAGDHANVQKELDQVKKELLASHEQNKATKQESIAVKGELKACKSELKNVKSQLDYASGKNTTLTRELDESRGLLDQRTEELGVYNLVQMPLQEKASEIDELATDCHKLAVKHFKSTIISDKALTILRDHLQNATQDFALSTARTQAAQLMRCAAVEHLIARCMLEHIFTDFHFPGFETAQSSIKLVLDQFDIPGGESRSLLRRNIVRGQLLAEFPDLDRDKEVHDAAIQKAVDHCDDILYEVFKDKIDTRRDFLAELGVLYERALELWAPLRRSLQRVSAVTVNSDDSDEFEIYDSIRLPEALNDSRRQGGSRVVLQLFPQITADDEILCNGFALFSDQSSAFCAKTEQETTPSSENSNGQGASQRGRRKSSVNGGAASLTLTSSRRLPRQTASVAGVSADTRNGL